MHLAYRAESCVCHDDGVCTSIENAKPKVTREYFLAHDRSARGTWQRIDGDQPRKAEHYFL